MGVTIEHWGEYQNHEILRYTLSSGGLKVKILNFGAIIQSLVFKNTDLVLGFDNFEGYIIDKSHQGAAIGRYANRINKGRFTLNRKEYQLKCDARGQHIHGGPHGFDRRFWNAVVIANEDYPTVRFSINSPDGDQGYPGNLNFSVTYKVTKKQELIIIYEGISDSDTLLNPTNHSYFNLNGGGDISETEIQISADFITPVDERIIPTGGLLDISNTPFDFRKGAKIGERINICHEQLSLTGGFDHNFVLNNKGCAAKAYSEKSGIQMTCFTDMPGLQFYTANKLNEEGGKNNMPLKPQNGFCMETQFFPDSPNHPEFPSAVIKKQSEFVSKTIYQFKDCDEI